MFPVTAGMKKAVAAPKQAKKVTEAKSKDILKDLEKQADEIDEEDLLKAVEQDEEEAAFNQEQLVERTFNRPARVEMNQPTSDRKRNFSEAVEGREQLN